MPYNPDEAEELITNLTAKKNQLEDTLNKITKNIKVIKSLKDLEEYDRDDKGIIKIDGDGKAMKKTNPAIDENTNKPMTKARKNEVYDSRKAEAEELLIG